MNNWSERLNAKVRAYNRVNKRAIELHAELVAMFRPFVGKKVLTNSGFVAKLRPQIAALQAREGQSHQGGFQLFHNSNTWSLVFTVKAWEPYQGEQYGGSYAEASIHVGEFGRLGASSGEHCDVPRDVLAKLSELPPNLRTDYNADEVGDLRIEAKKLEERAREAEAALYPFGKYDN